MDGYDEEQLTENVYRVSLRDNGYSESDQATDLCMLKCAELALGKGFKYFSIVDNFKEVENSSSTTEDTSVLAGTDNQSGSPEDINATQPNEKEQTYDIARPSTSNTIVCHKIYPSNGFAYEAKFVYQSLGLKFSSREEEVANEIPPPRQSSVRSSPEPRSSGSSRGSRSFPKFLKIDENPDRTSE